MSTAQPFLVVSDVIEASSDRVWDVISDFGGLGRWSSAVDSCTLDGVGVGGYRIVQIGDISIRERLEVWDAEAMRVRYRPVSGSVMPIDNMVVEMVLTPVGAAATRLDWQVEGTSTIDAAKARAVTEKRYRFRIGELKECLVKGC